MLQTSNEQTFTGRLHDISFGEREISVSGAAGLLNHLLDSWGRQDLARLATLGLVTAGVTHDLGNLLQVIATALRMIDRNLDDKSRADIHNLTDVVTEAVARASALSRQVLELSGADAPMNEVTHLGGVLIATKRLIALTTGPTISIELRLGKDVPAVLCNGRELENVILNLALNARDAMPFGGRLVLATFREDDREVGRAGHSTDARAVLQVTDTGCGMSAEAVRQAFRPFFTAKPAKERAGLGLAMVSDFARRSGGSAEIQSAQGEGTSIFIRLPAAEI